MDSYTLFTRVPDDSHQKPQAVKLYLSDAEKQADDKQFPFKAKKKKKPKKWLQSLRIRTIMQFQSHVCSRNPTSKLSKLFKPCGLSLTFKFIVSCFGLLLALIWFPAVQIVLGILWIFFRASTYLNWFGLIWFPSVYSKNKMGFFFLNWFGLQPCKLIWASAQISLELPQY